ncbi:sulfotransferase domain-containing protein [Marivirga sp.]|uniref:sulfotransferase domain-containing protein n=1 Tax=Marivirga sp. TaxID=2018662 RepID=UPI0025FA11DD|nr:sulfotransferase domain-containing protein [Marivirga sp.]
MLKIINNILFNKANKSTVFQHDDPFVQDVIKDPELTWLISFPRTGSHWLRMMMELYFEKPGLVLIYKYKNAKSFTCYHWHDSDLTTSKKRNVIYLYRGAVDTIFSQVKFEREDITDTERVIFWTRKYAKHLSKWILEEDFTKKKTLILYENLINNPVQEFHKITNHYNQELDEEKFEKVLSKITKEKIKKKTRHDQQVINLSKDYQKERQDFRRNFSDLITSQFLEIDERLIALKLND